MSEAGPVRAAHRFDEAALARYLASHLEGCGGQPEVLQIQGGQSNPTFLLRYPDRELVLRKQPPGPLLPSAHAVDREYRVLRALEGSAVPVPRAYLLCEDRDVIGTSFYVMERMRGRVFRDNALPDQTPTERAAIWDAMNATLAALHSVDLRAVGLEDYGRHGAYFTRQLRRWTQQWEATRGAEDLPELAALASWLPAHLPSDDETTLCHGDFRLENLMYHPSEPRVIAVFDWELSTLGHPLADLGYNCLPYHLPADLGSGLRDLALEGYGIPSEAEYVARYVERVGRRDGITPFHLAFACFRLAVILLGVLARARQGNAANDSAGEVGARCREIARVGSALAQGGDAASPCQSD